MSQKMTKEMWVELSRLLTGVENAFWELEEKARRLEQGTADLCNPPPIDYEDMDLLIHQVALAGRSLIPMLLLGRSFTLPNSKIPVVAPRFPDSPFELFSKAIKALRWLEECHDEAPSALGDEVKWLVPRSVLTVSDGEHTISFGPHGTTTGITRAWLAGMLASRCREGRAKAQKLEERAEAEVAKQERDDAQQARAKAEKERDDAEIRANLNIKGQLSEVLDEKILPEVKKGTKAAEGAETEAKKARQGIQRLLVPAEAIFRKSAQGIIKWSHQSDRRKKYTDAMKREVISLVDYNRNNYLPLDVFGICERILARYDYFTSETPEAERNRIIRNFQHSYEIFRKKNRKEQKSTLI